MQRIASYYLNAIAICVYLGMILAAYLLGKQYIEVCFLVLAIVALIAWLENQRRTLSISEVPISNIKSSSQGYVELCGKAISLIPSKSPLRGIDAVWYRFWVYSKDSHGIWQLEKYTTSQEKFGLQDSTGYCEVDPNQAEVIASDRHTQVSHQHKYIEDVLRTGRQLYVLGEFNSRHNTHLEKQIQVETKSLLAKWKENIPKLRLRFDLNNDGQIDLFEWEEARKQARHQVQQQHDLLATHHVPLIVKPQDKRPFLISGIAPHALRANYQFWRGFHLLILLASIAILATSAIRGVS